MYGERIPLCSVAGPRRSYQSSTFGSGELIGHVYWHKARAFLLRTSFQLPVCRMPSLQASGARLRSVGDVNEEGVIVAAAVVVSLKRSYVA